MVHKLKLIYFPLRGRAEFIRYILHAADVKFEEQNYSMAEWPSHKSEMPMGQMPVLEVDGVPLCQSMAIARYLAREYGLGGKDSFEQALCEMWADGIQDLSNNYRPVVMARFAGDKTKEAEEFKKLKHDSLIPFFERYEKQLVHNKTGWLVGHKMTFVDLALAEAIDRLDSCFEPGIFEPYPHLKAHHHKVHQLPAIAKHVASRPKYIL